jgi:hypothetical protein
MVQRVKHGSTFVARPQAEPEMGVRAGCQVVDFARFVAPPTIGEWHRNMIVGRKWEWLRLFSPDALGALGGRHASHLRLPVGIYRPLPCTDRSGDDKSKHSDSQKEHSPGDPSLFYYNKADGQTPGGSDSRCRANSRRF